MFLLVKGASLIEVNLAVADPSLATVIASDDADTPLIAPTFNVLILGISYANENEICSHSTSTRISTSSYATGIRK